jgi:hypothetical protein
MAKAGLSEIRKADLTDWREIGRAIRKVRGDRSLKEFAAVDRSR